MRLLLLSALLAAAALLVPAQNSRVEIDRLKPAIIRQRLETVTAKYSDRRATLEALFREAGCDGESLTSQKVPGSPHPNIICTLTGTDPDAGAVVVGGHYDKVAQGMGAVDDWSGAVLLPSLYESLKSTPRRHRYVFIAFAEEEPGLRGSTEYVHKLSKPDRAAIHAMINLECLGLTPPKVWVHRADKRLLSAYVGIAKALRIEAVGSNVDSVGDDDSHPFLEARIPVLTIHSLTQETFSLLHSPRDQLAAIHSDDYYAAYQLAATYLGFLDSFLQ